MLTYALTAYADLSGAHWSVSHTGDTPHPRKLIQEAGQPDIWVLIELEDDNDHCVSVTMTPSQAKMLAEVLLEYAQKAEDVQNALPGEKAELGGLQDDLVAE